jgi:hypothetical protein
VSRGVRVLRDQVSDEAFGLLSESIQPIAVSPCWRERLWWAIPAASELTEYLIVDALDVGVFEEAMRVVGSGWEEFLPEFGAHRLEEFSHE